MSHQYINVDEQDGVLIITLDDPSTRNANRAKADCHGNSGNTETNGDHPADRDPDRTEADRFANSNGTASHYDYRTDDRSGNRLANRGRHNRTCTGTSWIRAHV